MYKIRVDYETSEIGMCRAILSVTETDSGFDARVLKDTSGVRRTRLVTAEKFSWGSVQQDVDRCLDFALQEVQRRRARAAAVPDQVVYII